MLGSVFIVYFLATIPIRRRDQVRLLLDLILGGLRDGRTPEETIVAVSRTRERIVGPRFHMAAALIEQGEPLISALGKVPSYVPPNVLGLLRSGTNDNGMERAALLAKNTISSGVGKTSSAMQYAYLLVLMLLPFSLGTLLMWKIVIWPKMEMIIADLEGTPPELTLLVTGNIGWLGLGYLALAVGVALLLIGTLSTPKARTGSSVFGLWRDRLAYRLPWRNRLLKRDFSLTLALLLDAGIPEGEAVIQAGAAVGNRFVRWKSLRIAKELAGGVPLAKAIRSFDERREFQWRLSNAAHSGSGFVRALYGWHEALQAEAFQKEQAAAQITTTLLLLLNGAAVCLVVSSIFAVFVAMTSQAVLW